MHAIVALLLLASPVDPPTSPAYSFAFDQGTGALLSSYRYGKGYVTTPGIINTLWYKGGVSLEAVPLVAGSGTPTADAGGLDIAGGTLASGGVLQIQGEWPKVVGEAVEFCAEFTVADISGLVSLVCGFRHVGQPKTLLNYAIAAAGGANGNGKTVAYDDDAGAYYTDDDDWADTETHTVCASLDASGAFGLLVDDVPPPTFWPYTMPAGTKFIEFCEISHSADKAEDTLLHSWSLDLL